MSAIPTISGPVFLRWAEKFRDVPRTTCARLPETHANENAERTAGLPTHLSPFDVPECPLVLCLNFFGANVRMLAPSIAFTKPCCGSSREALQPMPCLMPLGCRPPEVTNIFQRLVSIDPLITLDQLARFIITIWLPAAIAHLRAVVLDRRFDYHRCVEVGRDHAQQMPRSVPDYSTALVQACNKWPTKPHDAECRRCYGHPFSHSDFSFQQLKSFLGNASTKTALGHRDLL